MKILTLLGSMRKDKYTYEIASSLLSNIKQITNEIDSEIIHIADMDVTNCKVLCSDYCSTHTFECCIEDDVNLILEKMIDADAIIIGAPLYFRVPPAKFHTFAERLVSIFFNIECQGKREENSPLDGKPCALIGVSEYSNPSQILEYLNDFINILKMDSVKLKQFPYLGIGGQGNVFNDEIFSPFENTKEMARLLVDIYNAK
ncbi:flavodoxin family protein [Wukongibacter baidiensis]|uniref:flavodoxin family protein n=1 Tax=Wukongibacter baidiensis TaxID=1723361 RepID=UPI003D7FD992